MATKLQLQLCDDGGETHFPRPEQAAGQSALWNNAGMINLFGMFGWLRARLQNDSLLRNSLFLMSSTAITSAVGYLYWVMAAHLYSATALGLASAYIATMSLTSTLASLGIGSALIQLLPNRTVGYEWSITLNACMAVGSVVSIVCGCVVALVFPFLSQIGGEKHRLLYLALFVGGVVLCTLSTLLDQVFVAERAASNTTIKNALFALLKLLLVLTLVQIGALGICASWILSLGITLTIAMLVLIPRLCRVYRLHLRGLTGQVRLLLPEVVGQHFINVGGLLPMYLLPVFVAVRLSATDNAYFYTTWMLGSLFFMVSASISTSLFSEGIHATHHLRRNVLRSALLISILLCPLLLLFILGGRIMLSLFGTSYAQHGLPLLLLLVVSAFPDAITNVYVSLLRVQRRLRSAALLNLGMGILTLILAWWLLPQLGIAGAGWSWLLAESVGSLVVGADAFRLYKHRSVTQAAFVDSSSRLTLRNALGLIRYVRLRIRFKNMCVGLFFLDRGSHIEVGPDAHLQFGRGIRIMRDFTAHIHGHLIIGNNVFFNRGAYVAVHSKLTIGDNCLFGEGVSLHDENHVPAMDDEPVASRGFITRPIVIGRNVWIGAKATILPGVVIGDNAVVGANAVVTRDVRANTIVGGIPARVIRELAPVPARQEASRTHETRKEQEFQVSSSAGQGGQRGQDGRAFSAYVPRRPTQENCIRSEYRGEQALHIKKVRLHRPVRL